MKILHLKLQAFGPFLNKQEIPFEDLNNKGMYLINGPTGVGKTSIFDAIMYALYNKASGEDRKDIRALRSQYASEDLETYVELTFSTNMGVYKIVRKPPQLRKKARGSGFIENPAFSELTLPSGEVLNKDVDNYLVNNVLFISYDQFKNIALLAQGEFKRLITASSEERAKILERIFDKTYYLDFQNKINDKAKESYAKLQNYDATLKTLLKQLQEVDDILGYNEALLDSSNIPSFIDHLNEDLNVKEEKFSLLKKELEEIEKNYLNKNNKLNQIKDNNKAYTKYFEAKKKLEQLELEKDKINLYNQFLKKYDEYIIILPIEQNIMKTSKELSSLNTNLNNENKALDLISKAIADLNSRKDEIQLMNAKIPSLNSSLGVLKSLNVDLTALKRKNDEYLRKDRTFKGNFDTFKQKEEEHKILRDHYFASTSYNLAKDLKEGEPCPVCGSISHPHLAEIANPISEDEYKNSEERLEKLRNNINQEMANLKTLKDTLDEDIKSFISKLQSNKVDFDTSDVLNINLSNSIKAIEVEINDINQKIEKFINDANKNNQDFTRCKSNIENLTKQLEDTRSKFESYQNELNEKFNENLLIKDIDSFVSFKLNNVDNIKNKNKIEKYCLEYPLSVNTQKTIIENTSEEVIKNGLINIDELNNEVKELLKAKNDKNQDANALSNLVNNNKKNGKIILDEFKKCQDVIKESQSINELARTVTGQNKYKLSFRMYILQDYFDKIIMQANKRLTAMSNGRYRLIRQKVEDRSGNAKTGLDLDVFDIETSLTRSADTLSGGEKFVTSLSLALGLSDIIESSHAIIQVESIFIDEGFGNLDDDYIDMAMKALNSLKDVSKSVGIISHAEKLKE